MSLTDILELAVRRAAEMLSADKAILLLPDEQGILHVSAAHGVDSDVVDRFRDSLDESLAGRLRDLMGEQMAEGFVAVPLVSSGNVIGLLAVIRPHWHRDRKRGVGAFRAGRPGGRAARERCVSLNSWSELR